MNELIEGPRRSKLTFAASRESRSALRLIGSGECASPSAGQSRACRARSPMWQMGAPDIRNHKTNSRHSGFCWPLHIRMPGRSSRSFSNTTTMGQGMGHNQMAANG
jgi:hypothetical protein